MTRWRSAPSQSFWLTSRLCHQVDVDMKLRSCSGSCWSVAPFSVDHPSYQTLQTDMDQPRRRPDTPPKRIPRIKLLPAKGGVTPSAETKSVKAARSDAKTQADDVGRLVLVEADDIEDEGHD